MSIIPKRVEKRAKKRCVGLSVQVTSSREGDSTYNSLPVLTAALSYQSSNTTAVSYLIARRIGDAIWDGSPN